MVIPAHLGVVIILLLALLMVIVLVLRMRKMVGRPRWRPRRRCEAVGQRPKVVREAVAVCRGDAR
jgi:hypothetical protein